MGFLCCMVLSLILLSFSVFASVGSVDDGYGQKSAACENAPESQDKSVSRDVNPANVLANLGTLVDSRQNKGKSKGDSKAVQ